MKEPKLKGKAAVVTGGARGIGRAIGERYAAEGATVVVADLDLNDGQTTAKAIGKSAFAVQLDVTRQDSIDHMVESVVAVTGVIDILVNNAGYFDMGPLLEITPQSFDQYFPLMLRACFSPCRGGPADGATRPWWKNY
jgi:galactitol 2-dehydrogenase